MKLYLSGPMTGMPQYNYPLFHDVADKLRAEGYEVYSPAEIDGGEQVLEGGDVQPWKYYMTKAIEMQMKCDAWAGLPGWWRSKGAKREFDLAVDLEHELHLVRIIPQSEGVFANLGQFYELEALQ